MQLDINLQQSISAPSEDTSRTTSEPINQDSPQPNDSDFKMIEIQPRRSARIPKFSAKALHTIQYDQDSEN